MVVGHDLGVVLDGQGGEVGIVDEIASRTKWSHEIADQTEMTSSGFNHNGGRLRKPGLYLI